MCNILLPLNKDISKEFLYYSESVEDEAEHTVNLLFHLLFCHFIQMFSLALSSAALSDSVNNLHHMPKSTPDSRFILLFGKPLWMFFGFLLWSFNNNLQQTLSRIVSLSYQGNLLTMVLFFIMLKTSWTRT